MTPMRSCRARRGVGARPRARAFGPASPETRTAIFASGCFWCTQSDFLKVPGVTAVVSGYTGGMTATRPTEQVTTGTTGHREAAQVTYDPSKVTYRQAARLFLAQRRPVRSDRPVLRQGQPLSARASSTHDDEQKKLGRGTKQALEGRFKGEKIATKILPATAFWPAEDYHQDYYKRIPIGTTTTRPPAVAPSGSSGLGPAQAAAEADAVAQVPARNASDAPSGFVIPASAKRVSGKSGEKARRWSLWLDSRSALRLAGMTRLL